MLHHKRVGIMGGTFDPIHIGHLILGENAYLQFQLDHVLFMPCGNPPHKKERYGRATTSQRIDMVCQAISSNPHFKISLTEAHEKGYTYTKETLNKLKAENPDTDYYFIMGADSLFAFETWKAPADICQLCTIVVAVRDHVQEEALNTQIELLKHKYGAEILKLNTPNIAISSNILRNWIASKSSIRYYVSDHVIDYIERYELYQECE